MESNHSGSLFFVSSQPAVIPSSRSMLSRDKRLPLDTWNSSGQQENVFGNQCSVLSPVDIPQNSMVGQQRQQISELQFDKYPTPQSFFMLGAKIQDPSDYLF